MGTSAAASEVELSAHKQMHPAWLEASSEEPGAYFYIPRFPLEGLK